MEIWLSNTLLELDCTIEVIIEPGLNYTIHTPTSRGSAMEDSKKQQTKYHQFPQMGARPGAWWFNWKRHVNLFVRCCPKCPSYYRGHAPKQGFLNPQIVGEVASRYKVDY